MRGQGRYQYARVKALIVPIETSSLVERIAKRLVLLSDFL